jgi:hypothetical protein
MVRDREIPDVRDEYFIFAFEYFIYAFEYFIYALKPLCTDDMLPFAL